MKKILAEFKNFIARGNVLDMAVGVIIGTAFTAIVNSLVKDILMPLLGLITGGLDFAALMIPLVSEAEIAAAIEAGMEPAMLKYGSFISAIINFLLIAIVIFAVTKLISTLRERNKKEEPKEEPKPARLCPFCKSEIHEEATRCPHCTSVLPEEK